jgi:hypothetical protein
MADTRNSVFPRVWFPSNVDDFKASLLQRLEGTDIAVQACTALPDGTRAQWNTFYGTARDFCKTPSVFFLSLFTAAGDANQGQEYESELQTWQQNLNAASCSVPLFDPNPTPVSTTVLPLLQWTTVAIGIVGGAYIVGKVADVTIDAMKLAPKRHAGERRLRR